MTTEHHLPRYTLGEEIANSIIHGVGAVLGIAGLGVLTAFASLHGDAWHIVGCSIFGAALILLYTTSTLYHSIPLPRVKQVLRTLDHSAIFILIAGTYTPFCLVTLRGVWGWTLFGIVWGLALIGMLQEIRPRSEARILSLVIYAVMGWVIIIAIGPLLDHLETTGLVLLATGGLLYTGGIVFYAFDDRFRHWHGIWHLFVIGGSLLHYLTIALYVI